ncbi:MAG: glycosyltransferase family 9 protein [Thermomicrobiales bacterium]
MTAVDPAWARARRILAVRLDNLGDVLVTTPAIRAVKAALPDARISLLASPVGAQVGRLNRDIDDVIVFEAPWVDPWRTLPHDSARERAMIERIRAGEFDAAVIFTSFRQSPLPAAYACYLADIPLRLAASIDGPGSLLTTRHKHPDSLMHEVERGLGLVGAVGIPPDDTRLVLHVPEEARRAAGLMRREWTDASLGDPDRPLVVVHPGCSMPARTYPAERYAEVVERMATEMGVTVALTGSGSERALVAGIAARLSAAARRHVHDVADALAFPELCALVERADLVVTNNTGPMHFAAALETPVVALFALTNPPGQWGPWRTPHRVLNHDVPCRICYARVCPFDQECLRLVTVDEVVDAARDLLHPLVARTAGAARQGADAFVGASAPGGRR